MLLLLLLQASLFEAERTVERDDVVSWLKQVIRDAGDGDDRVAAMGVVVELLAMLPIKSSPLHQPA